MRRLLTMVTMAVGLSTCSIDPLAFAQQGRPPAPGEGPNCTNPAELKADAQIARLMQDNDGDLWAMIRFTSTGRLLIGYLSHDSGKFCVTGEGRMNPES